MKNKINSLILIILASILIISSSSFTFSQSIEEEEIIIKDEGSPALGEDDDNLVESIENIIPSTEILVGELEDTHQDILGSKGVEESLDTLEDSLKELKAKDEKVSDLEGKQTLEVEEEEDVKEVNSKESTRDQANNNDIDIVEKKAETTEDKLITENLSEIKSLDLEEIKPTKNQSEKTQKSNKSSNNPDTNKTNDYRTIDIEYRDKETNTILDKYNIEVKNGDRIWVDESIGDYILLSKNNIIYYEGNVGNKLEFFYLKESSHPIIGSYIVKYVEVNGREEEILDRKLVQAPVGSRATEEAPNISGYTLVSEDIRKVDIVEGNKVIKFYYEKNNKSIARNRINLSNPGEKIEVEYRDFEIIAKLYPFSYSRESSSSQAQEEIGRLEFKLPSNMDILINISLFEDYIRLEHPSYYMVYSKSKYLHLSEYPKDNKIIVNFKDINEDVIEANVINNSYGAYIINYLGDYSFGTRDDGETGSQIFFQTGDFGDIQSSKNTELTSETISFDLELLKPEYKLNLYENFKNNKDMVSLEVQTLDLSSHKTIDRKILSPLELKDEYLIIDNNYIHIVNLIHESDNGSFNIKETGINQSFILEYSFLDKDGKLVERFEIEYPMMVKNLGLELVLPEIEGYRINKPTTRVIDTLNLEKLEIEYIEDSLEGPGEPEEPKEPDKPEEPKEPGEPEGSNRPSKSRRRSRSNESELEEVQPEIFVGIHYSYINGYEDGTIRPLANLTREEAATIVYRIMDEELKAGISIEEIENSFTDVNEASWSYQAIMCLSHLGIIEGYPDMSFKPKDKITRAEISVIISRLNNIEANSKDVLFLDIDNHWAQGEINSLHKKQWVRGYDDKGTIFKPNNPITRAEFVAMVNRMLGRKIENIESVVVETEYKDLDKDSWYYLDFLEATKSHKHYINEKNEEVWIEI